MSQHVQSAGMKHGRKTKTFFGVTDSAAIADNGFTIIELMMATMVFATILLLITSGVIHMGKSYYRGLSSSSTQNIAANALNTIAQSIQLGAGSYSTQTDPTSHLQVICIGSQEYIFLPGGVVHKGAASSTSNIGIYQRQQSGGNCDDPIALANGSFPTDGQELLADNMRLLRLSISNVTGSGCNPAGFSSKALCNVTVSVGFGSSDDLFCDAGITTAGQAGNCASGSPSFATGDIAHDLLTTPNADIRCRTQPGSQFCVVSRLATTVERRL